MVFGTAFVFITLIDFSFVNYIYTSMQVADASSGVPLTVSHPLAQALGHYLTWRTSGTPLLKWWEAFMALVVPLAFFAALKEVVDTIRGRKAPLLRHAVDVESLLQLVAVVALVAGQAAPAHTRFIALTMNTSVLAVDEKGQAIPQPAVPASGVDVLHEVRQLTNIHFLIFSLNAVQWLIPLWRLRIQQRQNALMATEVAGLEKAAAAAAHAAAIAQKNADIIAAAIAAQKAAPEERAEAAERPFAGHDASDLRRRK